MKQTTYNNSTWHEWSKYVLISLEKFADEIEKNHNACNTLNTVMIKNLAGLKEQLVEKIGERVSKDTLDDIVSDINRMIDSLSQDTDKVDVKINDLVKDIITPLRIKMAVMSFVFGSSGGVIILLIQYFLMHIL
ncbi:MAG: hypothetical protein U9O94_03240 [Nanoarchaeota archaeon]|nr:hypothetical protein [Nanoarchaeota archaeon]